jgi:hypothetical protein
MWTYPLFFSIHDSWLQYFRWTNTKVNKGYFIPAREQIWYLSKSSEVIIAHVRTNGEVPELLIEWLQHCALSILLTQKVVVHLLSRPNFATSVSIQIESVLESKIWKKMYSSNIDNRKVKVISYDFSLKLRIKLDTLCRVYFYFKNILSQILFVYVIRFLNKQWPFSWTTMNNSSLW